MAVAASMVSMVSVCSISVVVGSTMFVGLHMRRSEMAYYHHCICLLQSLFNATPAFVGVDRNLPVAIFLGIMNSTWSDDYCPGHLGLRFYMVFRLSMRGRKEANEVFN